MKSTKFVYVVIMALFLIGLWFLIVFFDCAFCYERKEVFITSVTITPGLLGVSFEAKGETKVPVFGVYFLSYKRMIGDNKIDVARKGRFFYILEFGLYDQLVMGLELTGIAIVLFIIIIRKEKKRRRGFIVGDEMIINEYNKE
jgi:hypothetical protein